MSNPYASGGGHRSSGAAGMPSAKKASKKKGGGGGGNFLSDLWDEGQKAVGGVANDIAGLGGAAFHVTGGALGGAYLLGKGAITGDKNATDQGWKAWEDVTNNAGAAAVGGFGSLGGTAADIADLTIPDVAGVDVGGGLRSLTEEAMKGFAKTTAGATDRQAEKLIHPFRPKPLGQRMEERGALSPLLEDLGNVAMAGGAVEGLANLGTAAKLGEAGRIAEGAVEGARYSTTGLARAQGGDLARGAAEVGHFMKHPLRGAYTNTVGQLAKAADEATVARATPPDPLAQEFRQAMGMDPLKEGVVQKARPLSARRLAKIRAAYEGTDFANLSDADLSAVHARLAEEKDLFHWLQTDKGVKFDFVDAKDNPYYDAEGRISPETVREDILNNNHLYVDNTGTIPGENGAPPGLTPEQNNIRRALHDYLAHRSPNADFTTAGENLAYQNEAQFYTPEAMRSVAFDQQGPTAVLSETGAFPEHQQTGALPPQMADPNYLSGAAPWARSVIERLPEGGLAERAFAKLGRLGTARMAVSESNRLRILYDAARNRLMHDPAVTNSVEAGHYLVSEFGVKPSEANRIVGAIMRDTLNGRKAYFDALIEQDPGIAPYLEEAGYQPEKLPEAVRERMTPEQRAQFQEHIDASVAAWEDTLSKRVEMLSSTRKGMKGLEDVGSEEVSASRGQMRRQKEIDNLRAQAERLRARGVKDTAANVAQQGRKLEEAVRWTDRLNQAVQKGQGAAEELFRTRQWKAKGFTGRRWEAAVPAAVDLVTTEGGFTYNPYEGEFVVPATASTDLPQGVRSVPGEGYAVSVLPDSTLKIPYEEWVANGPAYLEQMKGFAPLFENPDYNIGGWLDEDTGIVHLDVSQNRIDGQPINRSQAMLLAAARDQISVMDLGNRNLEFPGPAGSPKIARQILASSKKGIAARLRFAQRLYDIADAEVPLFNEDGSPQLNADGSQATKPLYPGITPEDVDAHMAAMDSHAWTAHRANPEKYPTVADVYRDVEAKGGKKFNPKGARSGEMYQTYLGRQLGMPLWEEATQNVKDWQDVAKWYHNTRDFIQQHYGGKEVTLLNGRKVPADVFMTDAMALLSVAASPQDNLKYALTAYDNLKDFHAAGNDALRRAQELTHQMMEMDPKKRVNSDIFKELTADTHLYTGPKKPLFELMNGTLLDEMDNSYFQEVPQELWGTGAKPVSTAKIPPEELAANPERAVMEQGGSRMYAKIRSFKDNMMDPENSTSVTLDSWMARLFGVQDWMAPGAYREYANGIRKMAEQISEQEGRVVRPHEVQAVLWAYAKQEIGRMDAGLLRAQTHDVLRNIDRGTWTPERDAINIGMAQDEAQLGRAQDRAATNAARTARRDELVPDEYRDELGKVKWSKVPAKQRAEIMAQVDAEVGAKEGNAWLPETEKRAIRRSDEGPTRLEDMTTAITKPLTTSGMKESQATFLERRRASYAEVEAQARAQYEAGDVEGAKQTISAWANKRIGKIEAGANEFSDFSTVADNPSEGLAAALARHGAQPEELLQSWNRDVKGSFLDDGHKALMTFFQTADASTLTHEGAHWLRTLIGDEGLRMLEQNMGFKKGEGWSRGREEQFANLFTAWMASGRAPKEFGPIAQRLKSALGEEYVQFNRRFNAGRIDPLLGDLFNEWLSDTTVPDIHDEVATLGKQPNIRLQPGTNIPDLEESPPGGPMAAGVPGRLTGKNAQEGYRMGAQAERLRSKVNRSNEAARYAKARAAAAGKAVADLQATLAEERLPSQVEATKLEARAARRQAALDAHVGQAGFRSWPREYMHIGETLDQLVHETADHPEMAQVVEDFGKTFPAVLDRMKANGVDPTHIRDFTPDDVRKLVYDTLHPTGKGLEAGTRKASVGELARTGRYAEGIDAVAASMLEVHREMAQSQMADVLEHRAATPATPGMELPKGYSEWDPEKPGVAAGSVKEGEQIRAGTRYIMPKEVLKRMEGLEKDYNHWLWTKLAKVTNPWRALVLTMSPRWYVNNFMGNVVLATMEGVRLRDWRAAWESFKTKDAGGRYADVPAIQGHSMVSDIGEKNLVRTKGVREAMSTEDTRLGKFNAARRQVGHNLRRMNEVVDEFARSAVYHRTLRVGGSEIEALQRAQEALIDYGNLTPFEQQVVRSVVPFYAWQKGILKVVAKMPVDHPLAMGLMMQVGDLQQRLAEDKWGGDLPLGYAGLAGLPGGGAINTRGFNPFIDSLSLTTPDGISSSINPYVQIMLRSAFGAPDGGFVEHRRVGPFGNAIPDVNPVQGLAEMFQGVPQARVAGVGTDKSVGQNLFGFGGINELSKEDVKAIIERTAAAKAQVAANAPFPARKKKLPKSTTAAPL